MCSKELSRQLFSHTLSRSRVETWRSLFCGTKRVNQCQKNEVQNKEILMVLQSVCSLAMGMVASDTRLHVTGKQAAGAVPWIESTMLLLQNFQPRGPGKSHRSRGPAACRQENEGAADFWYLDDVDILCHPIENSTKQQPPLLAKSSPGSRKSVAANHARPQWPIDRESNDRTNRTK